jgi:hypothetical protein
MKVLNSFVIASIIAMSAATGLALSKVSVHNKSDHWILVEIISDTSLYSKWVAPGTTEKWSSLDVCTWAPTDEIVTHIYANIYSKDQSQKIEHADHKNEYPCRMSTLEKEIKERKIVYVPVPNNIVGDRDFTIVYQPQLQEEEIGTDEWIDKAFSFIQEKF